MDKVKLVGSIYYSTEGKAHAATKVQISTSATFGTLAYEATNGAVTSVKIKAADIASNASYYWRMAYQDADGAWSDWSVPTSFAAGTLVDLPKGTGGTITEDGDYTIHTFTSSGSFVLPADRTADVLIVAGGGGGGSYRGGGGGGGVVYRTGEILAAGSYTVTIGSGGGVSPGTQTEGVSGGNSTFSGLPAAIGGGGGGKNGGSGGGGGQGTAGQGFAGGANGDVGGSGGGGGGGGVGADRGGSQSGSGGIGFACAISPAATHYAGGGGGYAQSGYCTGGSGGIGGGGAGNLTGDGAGKAGAPNTGGGGGGASGYLAKGAAGGKGIVIVRYLS